MVEEILSMTTGSHLLGAFNIDFDSFVDNVVFCALIDRVGKFQLSMQKISAYKPMAESMPQMLREEAFHLAAGVVPMRRWATQAARGEVYVTMAMLQKTIDKWLPRGLEMFGDERGGGTNVRFGPQADEERRGAAALLPGGGEAGAGRQPALRPRPPARAGPAGGDRGGGPPDGRRSGPRTGARPTSSACRTRTTSAAAACPPSPWSASTARASPTPRPTSPTSATPCPSPTWRATTSWTTSNCSAR